MISGVYKIINTFNGQYYIGSSVNIRKRIIGHYCSLRKNRHHSRKLQNSYNKHGKMFFSHEVLEYCPEPVLQEREQYYLDRMFNNKCLNILKDAYSCSGEKHPMYGKTHTEESRKKIREARSKQTISHSAETRLKMGKSRKGRKVDMSHINKMIKARNGKAWNKGLSCPNKLKTVLNEETKNKLQAFYDNTNYNKAKSINETAKEFNLDWEVTKRNLKI